LAESQAFVGNRWQESDGVKLEEIVPGDDIVMSSRSAQLMSRNQFHCYALEKLKNFEQARPPPPFFVETGSNRST
jgi:hypothetical protein